MTGERRHRYLCADDYAMTAGVSRGIEQLAQLRKISATSAMVTTAHWAADAARIRELRGHIAIGLHLNLTLGVPSSGTCASLAPSGRFLELQPLIKAALTGRIAHGEARDEIRRQLDAFETALGYAPDHIDGHQHVHVLPVIRGALLDEVATRYRERPPLLRDPGEGLASIATTSPARGKALVVKALASGFSAAARRRGLTVNSSFAGFSGFDTSRPFESEIVAALDRRRDASAFKIVMCHPGFADEELGRIDPVVARRQQELETLERLGPPEAVLWHPYSADGGVARVDRPVPLWREAWGQGVHSRGVHS